MARTFELDRPVGRDEELALADGLLRATLADARSADPHIRALLVGGDAGIGKTTLVHALGARALALGLGFTVGHCLDLATGPPFGPVTEALREMVRHRGAVLEAVPAPARWLAAEVPSSAAGSLDSLLQTAEALAQAAPFVFVLEDLHWADTTVRDFTLALLRTCRAPLLLVVTLRTDELTRRHPVRPLLLELTRSPSTTRADLVGLDTDGVGQLAQRRTGHALPPAGVSQLLERSDGNPLHVEELLDAADTAVPLPLHDLLLRHAEKLSTRSARLVRLASVGGSTIEVDVLREASGLPDQQFQVALQEALDANVIVRRRDRFAFRHALLREAIHDDVLPYERSEMHAAYAAVLRGRVESGTTAERWQLGTALALHAYAAHDIPLTFEASVWAGLAGKQYGAAAAADHFERALALWDRVPDAARVAGLAKADLARLAAKVLANEGVRERVHALLRRAVALLEPDDDPLVACRVYTAVGNGWAEIPGLLSRAQALERAIELAGDEPSRELADALIASSFHQCRREVYGPALSLATRAVSVAGALEAGDLLAESRWQLADPLWCLGRCAEALAVYRDAVELAQRADEPGTALEASGELAYFLLLAGRAEDGLAVARRVQADAERAGLTRFVAVGAEQEVEWLIWDGRFTEAETLFEAACLPAKQRYRDWRTRVTLLLARGDAAAALALEEAAIAANEDPPGIDNSPRLIDVFEAVSDHERMLAPAQALLATIQHTDSPLFRAEAASCAYRALVAATTAGLEPPEEIASLAAQSLDFARHHASPEWSQTWYGMHLALAVAYEAQLFRRPAIPEWRQATDLASHFGRYTTLRPRLELARELLGHGARDEGKELLVSIWHDARTMGARWFEQQATLAARRFRVPLPHGDAVPGPLQRLTPREREVLDLVSTGATDRAIAAALFITEKTASAHVGRVLAKLGVANRGQAAAVARAASDGAATARD